jgi:hypothetical protein
LSNFGQKKAPTSGASFETKSITWDEKMLDLLASDVKRTWDNAIEKNWTLYG